MLRSRIIIFLISSSFIVSVFFLPSFVFAKKTIEQALPTLGTVAGPAGVETGEALPETIGKYIKAALSIVAIIFFILMIYAGFTWMTAQGKEDVIEKARKTIIRASIGLVIIVASYAITSLVTARLIAEDKAKPELVETQKTPPSDEGGAMGCCIDKISAGVYAKRGIISENKCINEQGTDGYAGDQVKDWDFYPSVLDEVTCNQVWDCWNDWFVDKENCLKALGL